MKITVKALPVHDIIKDLSRQWQVPIADDSGELTIQVPKDLGEGYVRGSSFYSGLGIIEYHCKFKKDFSLVFSINQTHPLKYIFCAKGLASHTFEGEEKENPIEPFQNIIVSSSGKKGHILNFKANTYSHIISIEIIRGVFNNRKNYNFEGLTPELKHLFKDSVAEKKFFYQGNYSIKAADLVEEINQKKFQGFLRSILLEGKIMEMLVVQIEQYLDDQREGNLPQILRRSDVEKVQQATQYINNNINKNLSVDQIAKEVGTNVNKLQEGFKYMYNHTVNKYMQQVKLEAARELLGNSDFNISQIVHQIGLTNRSYFSKIFKERYGVSPKYFLKASGEINGEEDTREFE